MKLERVDAGSEHFRGVWELYESAFPPDERRDLGRQNALFKRPEYLLFAALDEKNTVAGFLSLWEFGGFVFMEHLAVQGHMRGKGFGTEIIKAYMSGCKKNVVLEVERPGTEIQKRRIAFYERLGFKLNHHDYIQPPYGPGKNPVPMRLMSYPGTISEKEFPLLRKDIHLVVYGLKEPLA
ncbi:MAG: GNAT family N-acetyltransferase [Candidatus ainarchaeum sp.]|nr:GNAT family N-acetyltransferase [Candidatus ainarchaeum sp.]